MKMKPSYKIFVGILLLLSTWAAQAQESEAKLIIEPTDKKLPVSIVPKPEKDASALAEKPVPTAGQDEKEIVIELTGAQETEGPAVDDIVIWDKTSAQLAKLLRGVTREEALYRITSVSSKDTPVKAPDGKRYRFVQYGHEGDAYRLLFQAKDPQTFIACAADTEEALKLALQYKLGLGITENEFLETYAKDVSSVFLPIDDGRSLYRLERPHTSPLFFLFENKVLSRSLTENESDQLVREQELALRQRKQTTVNNHKQVRSPDKRTILIQGGTVHDQLYMPKLVNPDDIPGLPRLTPSSIPSGTPLWSQEVFK